MRFLIVFSYDGSKYFGFQKQKEKKTIQKTMEQALYKIAKTEVKITPSGRTDTGVHALNQTAHFDLDINITADELKKALNAILPADIYVKKAKEKNNFHARFDAIKKEYAYYINIGDYNVFEKDYVMQLNKKLDVDKMKQASKFFLGTHDFSSFCKKRKEEDAQRTIFDIKIVTSGNKIKISIIGSGFLRYMVRNMVGTLIEVGQEKISVDQIKKILQSKDRCKAGAKAPAEGLYLRKAHYKKSCF